MMSYPQTLVPRKSDKKSHYRCVGCGSDIDDLNRRSAPKVSYCKVCTKHHRDAYYRAKGRARYILKAWTNRLDKNYYLICEGRLP